MSSVLQSDDYYTVTTQKLKFLKIQIYSIQ